MKGYRFYLEYKTPADKRKGKNMGTVVAAVTEGFMSYVSGKPVWMHEGLSGLFDYADSPVVWGSSSADYLRDNCRRIPEAIARIIHPALFVRLDEPEG